MEAANGTAHPPLAMLMTGVVVGSSEILLPLVQKCTNMMIQQAIVPEALAVMGDAGAVDLAAAGGDILVEVEAEVAARCQVDSDGVAEGAVRMRQRVEFRGEHHLERPRQE